MSKKSKSKTETKASSELIALRDFECQYNREQVRIKKGDDVAAMNLPAWLITNLKTEKVLKG
jgi:hypothetical protein